MSSSPCVVLLLGCLAALAGCRSDSGQAPIAAATGSTDACRSLIAEVGTLCGDFVDGRAVRAECALHALTLQRAFVHGRLGDPLAAPAACATQLDTLRRDQAERPVQPAVSYGEACQAFAARVKRGCVDGLPGELDPVRCKADFGRLAIARAAGDSQRESVCELGLRGD
jgi:hypothetical protein